MAHRWPLQRQRGDALFVLLVALALPSSGSADRDSKRRQQLSLGHSALQLGSEGSDRGQERDRGTGFSHQRHRHGQGRHRATGQEAAGEAESSSGNWWPWASSGTSAANISGIDQTAVATVPSATHDSKDVSKNEGKIAELAVASATGSIVGVLGNTGMRISGATGPVADLVNGDYVPAATSVSKYNGKVLYRRKDNPNLWLRYVTAGGLKQWRVSTSTSLNANNDKGYIYCEEPGLDRPSDAKKWFVWLGTRWGQQASVTVSAFDIKSVTVVPTRKTKERQTLDKSGGTVTSWLSRHKYSAALLFVLAWLAILAYFQGIWKGKK